MAAGGEAVTRFASLAVQGSDTQWYKNVRQNRLIECARGEAEFRAVPVTAAKLLKAVLEKFREKFGASDVKKYHLKFDVALLVRLKSFPPLI